MFNIPNSIIKVDHVSKSFHVGTQDVLVLKDISFEVKPLDFLIIFGPSGCGKSTLLHTILGLEEPTSGTVIFLGTIIYGTQNTEQRTEEKTKFKELNSKFKVLSSEDERSDFRKQHVGMVYQQPNWIRSLTVVENVAFPLLLLGQDKKESLEKARQMLKTVEMLEWQNYIPTELSSGQQQRVALARALITNPEVIIADEPTGNLDYESGQELMRLLTTLNKTRNNTIVMVTHDLEYLNFAKTAVRMFDGKIIGSYKGKEKEKLMKEIKSKRGNGKTVSSI